LGNNENKGKFNMIKSTTLALFLMAFALIALPLSSAYACGDHSQDGHSHDEEQCKPCQEAEAKFQAAKKTKLARAAAAAKNPSSIDHSKKGSFTFRSKSTFASQASDQYN